MVSGLPVRKLKENESEWKRNICNRRRILIGIKYRSKLLPIFLA
jgi:hypothetical protein